MENVITIKGLVKAYGKRVVLDGVDLTVKRGSIFGLLGHNGAGKTTTLECLLGTKPVTHGEVRLFGQNPSVNRKALFQHVGVQFQNTAFQNHIRVGELCAINHSLYPNANPWPPMLEAFGLRDKTRAYVSGLSGGEQQKLCIVLAVMHKPKLVFLDELTTGLDPKARREVWQYLRRLQNDGTTILLTSHYMDEVAFLCDEIAILRRGKIAARGTVREVTAAAGQAALEDAFLHFAEDGRPCDLKEENV